MSVARALVFPVFMLGCAGFVLGCNGAGRLPLPDARVVHRDSGLVPRPDGGIAIQHRPDGGAILPPSDRSIVLPYFGPSATEDFELTGEIGQLDVFFSIDTTGSFGGEIDNLQSELASHVIPSLRARVEDVAFGVARFEDFPHDPFGSGGDSPFRLLAPITTRDERVGAAVASLDQPLGNGGNLPEAGAEALWQIATGDGYSGLIAAFSPTSTSEGRIGGVGFRDRALRAVVHVTDAISHEPEDYDAVYPGTHSMDEAADALADLGVHVIGIASEMVAVPELRTLATRTGAIADPIDGECTTGIDGGSEPPIDGRCPLVFRIRDDGSGLADAIVDSISQLVLSLSYEQVWVESDDTLGFVRTVEALPAMVDGTDVERADRRPNGDGVLDTYLNVPVGAHLAFRVILANETIPPADYDQIFHVTLRVMGDGLTLISRRIEITVPRGRLDGGARDAG